MSTIKTNAILDASGGNTTTINGVTPNAYNTMGKNRIINGAMEIDQRNAGASKSVSGNDIYTLDRYKGWANGGGVFSVQQSSTAPDGFNRSAVLTVTTADASVAAGDNYRWAQDIEGYNVSDLSYGSSGAKTVTVSFWVRSNLTGTYGGSLYSVTSGVSYVYQYTINSADTWEQKSITISGNTANGLNTTNGNGLRVYFDLGSGSNYQNATGSWVSGEKFSTSGNANWIGTLSNNLYITGVQLEVGSVATEFERRPYGTELALCQRYYATTYNTGAAVGSASLPGALYKTLDGTQSYASLCWNLPVTMRATPSYAFYSPYTGTSGKFYSNQSSADINAIAASTFAGMNAVAALSNGATVNAQNFIVTHFSASAEL